MLSFGQPQVTGWKTHTQICTKIYKNNNTVAHINTNLLNYTFNKFIDEKHWKFRLRSGFSGSRVLIRARFYAELSPIILDDFENDIFGFSARFSSHLEDDQNLYINRGRHGRWLTLLTKGEPHKWAAGWRGQSSGELFTFHLLKL